jgi:hypothetical protein
MSTSYAVERFGAAKPPETTPKKTLLPARLTWPQIFTTDHTIAYTHHQCDSEAQPELWLWLQQRWQILDLATMVLKLGVL